MTELAKWCKKSRTMRPKSPSPVRRLRGAGVLILLTVLMLFVLQGCGVSGGDGAGGDTVPVVVTMTMPGPTIVRAPEGLFQYLWAKVEGVLGVSGCAERGPSSAQAIIGATT